MNATTLPQLRPRERTSVVPCAVIFRQFSDTIRVQKVHVGAPNLEMSILAALDTGRRKGLHPTITRDMAEASGLSMGANYDYLESWETLLRTILAGVGHTFVPLETGEQNDPTLRLHGLIRRLIEVSDTLQRRVAFAFLEIRAIHKDARDIVLQSELRNERLMADAIGLNPTVNPTWPPQVTNARP